MTTLEHWGEVSTDLTDLAASHVRVEYLRQDGKLFFTRHLFIVKITWRSDNGVPRCQVDLIADLCSY